MKIYFSWDGDSIGRVVGQLALADQDVEMRQKSEKIEQANAVFSHFVVNAGGIVVSCSGDEGNAWVPAEHLVKLPELCKQYNQICGATVSVGIGMKLSESSKALLIAKHRGKNQICLYDNSMEQELAEIKDPNEDEKLSDHYLEGNADSQPVPQAADSTIHSQNEQANAFDPSGVDAQLHELNEEIKGHTLDGQLSNLHEEMKPHSVDGQLQQLHEDNPPQPAPEQEVAANTQQAQEQPQLDPNQDPSLQQQLETDPVLQELSSEEEKEAAGADQQVDQAEINQPMSVLQLIATTLSQVKEQAAYIEGLKSHNPQAYAAIKGIVQAMLAMAHELMGKSEDDGSGGQPADEGGASAKSAKNVKYHRVTYPVGTNKNGKIKIRFPDGHTGWIAARAGQVMGQGGQAISAKTTKDYSGADTSGEQG